MQSLASVRLAQACPIYILTICIHLLEIRVLYNNNNEVATRARIFTLATDNL